MSLSKEQTTEAVTVLQQMIDLLGLTARVSVLDESDNVVLGVESEEPGRLIGRKGRDLESLQYLLNRVLGQKYGEMQPVMIDVDGYQTRPPRGRGRPSSDAENKVRQRAIDAAKEAKRWGTPKTIGPLNAAERRIVHTTLRDDRTITTESGPEDERGMKKITITVVDDNV
jgi:spoIIIJ-associated protein